MRSDAKNLEAIQKAIKSHAERCKGNVIAILMNPFEVERLGWDEFMGIPIEGDGKVGTGRVRIVCDLEGNTLKPKESAEEKFLPMETPEPVFLPDRDRELQPA